MRTNLAAVLLLAALSSPVRAQDAAPPDPARDAPAIEPLLPPGIGDFNLELFGKFAYLWALDDGTQVIEVLGDFNGRLGQHRLQSRDAVIWFRVVEWNDRRYYDAEVFLWQNAEVTQPTGTIETGPALLVTLRTFGKLLLNIDSTARMADVDSELYREASTARRLLDYVPADEAEQSETPVLVSPSIEQLALMKPKVRKRVSYRADQVFHEQHGEQSVVITYGGVHVSQGSPAASGDYLELRADAAVVYLHGESVGDAIPGLVDESRDQSKRPARPPDVETTTQDV
ncbi:MAG TPA: hypothetical protein VNT79_08945, partial [Phycisphaerae bacterium]|nr:hypothetical protein [Phycisphaerae bacterium]